MISSDAYYIQYYTCSLKVMNIKINGSAIFKCQWLWFEVFADWHVRVAYAAFIFTFW